MPSLMIFSATRRRTGVLLGDVDHAESPFTDLFQQTETADDGPVRPRSMKIPALAGQAIGH